jgi:glutathione S-transferase
LQSFKNLLCAVVPRPLHRADDVARTEEYLSFAQNEFLTKAAPADVFAASLEHIDSNIRPRVFLLGTAQPALADWVVFAAAHFWLSAPKESKDATTRFPSLCRWFNYLQNQPAARGVFAPVTTIRPASLEVCKATMLVCACLCLCLCVCMFACVR